jgi:hypothetical protein
VAAAFSFMTMDAIIFLQRMMGEGRENIGRGKWIFKKGGTSNPKLKSVSAPDKDCNFDSSLF